MISSKLKSTWRGLFFGFLVGGLLSATSSFAFLSACRRIVWLSSSSTACSGLSSVATTTESSSASLLGSSSLATPLVESSGATIIDDSIHLVSLQWTPDDRISKTIRDVWKWKDVALGDGRDFFVPKPKTMQALQDYILKYSPSIQECAILSNCARFEILFVTNVNVNHAVPTSSSTSVDDDPMDCLCRCIASQVLSSRARAQSRRSIYALLNQHMDVPDLAIYKDAPVRTKKQLQQQQPTESNPTHGEDSESFEVASDFWDHYQGVEAICRHLSLVAAGMALRPRRPDRPVIFRPFSSRDAHILLQLKRTKEVAQPDGRIRQLFDYALRAGKAARNSKHVPELEWLRSYGSGDSKYSTQPPLHLSKQVAEVGEDIKKHKRLWFGPTSRA